MAQYEPRGLVAYDRRGSVARVLQLLTHAMPPKFYDRGAAGVAEGQFGKQLGNGISCNVMMRWLPKALFSAGLVHGYHDYWRDTVRQLRDLNATHAVRSLRNQ